jgi:hypothetical protein
MAECALKITNHDKGAKSENQVARTSARLLLTFPMSEYLFLNTYNKTDAIANKNIRYKYLTLDTMDGMIGTEVDRYFSGPKKLPKRYVFTTSVVWDSRLLA